LNLMTLGGMALAVGILVDDATVAVESFHRQRDLDKPVTQAILDSAREIAAPAFVSTLCICIVFVPVVLIAGAAKSLFVPLAMSVVFAMLTSYFLSRTLVPTMMQFLLGSESPDRAGPGPLVRLHAVIERAFDRLRAGYTVTLSRLLDIGGSSSAVRALCVGSVALVRCSVRTSSRTWMRASSASTSGRRQGLASKRPHGSSRRSKTTFVTSFPRPSSTR